MDANRDCDNDEKADDMSNGDDYDGNGHDRVDIDNLDDPDDGDGQYCHDADHDDDGNDNDDDNDDHDDDYDDDFGDDDDNHMGDDCDDDKDADDDDVQAVVWSR